MSKISHKRRITKDDMVEVKLYLPRKVVNQLSMLVYNMFGTTRTMEEWMAEIINFFGQIHHEQQGSYRRDGQVVHDKWAGTIVNRA